MPIHIRASDTNNKEKEKKEKVLRKTVIKV
jgi:hypothetical protein